MLKRVVFTAAVVALLVFGAGLLSTADAHGWRGRHRRQRPYLAGPPIVLRGSYYPVQYYYAPPYWPPYDYGYSPYYRHGYRYPVGW